jgi:hypothetical protein
MATSIQIQCVNKTDRYNPHERISHVGGVNADQDSLEVDPGTGVDGTESGQWRFYVSVGGHSVWVVVATSRFGNKYLKTEADGEQPDNLLSLPECP